MDHSLDGDIIASDPDSVRRAKRRAYAKAYRLRHPDKIKALEKARSQRRQRDPELQRVYDKSWRERHPDKAAARKRAWDQRNPEKVKAQWVAQANIPLPETCERCGKSGDLHRHHPDYTKPLLVMILCPLCHKAAHKEMMAET